MKNFFRAIKSIVGIGTVYGNAGILWRFAAYHKRFQYFFLIEERWVKGICTDSTFYSADGVAIQKLKHFVVAYRNGQLAYESRPFRVYPEGMTGLVSADAEMIELTKEELEKGRNFCKISYSSSPVFIGRSGYYQTTIENTGEQKIKVLAFGAFIETDNHLYKLNTITGSLFTADDFNNWYMDSTDSWIFPRQLVADPINYGGARNNWAYKIETGDGSICWVGEMA